jgi:RNA polymerase sigma-70 factor (ECF subfamily)
MRNTPPAQSTVLDELSVELVELIPSEGSAEPADHAAHEGAHLDAQLVERARTDPEAFGLLYERYVDRIYSYIYHRVGNAQDAEDLTGRTFHRALDAIDSYEERGLPFAAWLFRIAHNLVANWHRDRSRRRHLSIDRLWSQRNEMGDPEHTLVSKETEDALLEAINRLPDDRRDLLIYKFSSQMSNTEIGDAMNKSESAIKSLYFRTLASLRKELEERGWGAHPDDRGDISSSAGGFSTPLNESD